MVTLLPFCLLALCILAGCEGSGSSKSQIAKGDGFTFEVPAGWRVTSKPGSVVATPGGVDRLVVSTFKLEKPYRTALFAAAAHELDGVAARIAGQLSGRLKSSSTARIAGRKARSYLVEFGGGKVEEIAFVLKGQSEYELLCRRDASASDTACRRLFATFSLS